MAEKSNMDDLLQNDDKTVKKDKKTVSNSVKKNAKKLDKGYVIAIALCVAIALLVVGMVVLPEPIAAAVSLKNMKNFIADSTEFTVVVNSPSELEGILNDKEAVVRDSEADELAKKISLVLENVKYSDTEKIDTGVWKTKLVIYNATDEEKIYIDSESIYIENNGKLIEYKVSDKAKDEYTALYSELTELLNGSKK